MDDLLIGAVLKDRRAWETVQALGSDHLTEFVKKLYSWASVIYDRDKGLESIPQALMDAYAKENSQNQKHYELFGGLLNKAYEQETSTANVVGLLADAKTAVLAAQLAEVTNKRDRKGVTRILAELEKIGRLQESEENEDLPSGSSVFDLVTRRLNQDTLIKVYPKNLNEHIGGGLMGGHHVLAFARPEAGKSAFGTTCAAGFIKQPFALSGSGIHLINEDRKDDIELRNIACLTGIPVTELRNPERQHEAQSLLDKYGYKDRILYADCHPGSLVFIKKLFMKYKPKWLICDQLRNIDPGKSESNTHRLDSVGRGIRDLLKEFDVVGISLVQAGDSASGKRVLTMSDVDSSKTGLPACCDVMVGIGMDEALEQMRQRCLSVCKNKMPDGKGHGTMLVKYQQDTSKFVSLT